MICVWSGLQLLTLQPPARKGSGEVEKAWGLAPFRLVLRDLVKACGRKTNRNNHVTGGGSIYVGLGDFVEVLLWEEGATS